MKDTIIIHCSATRAGQDITAADIDCWHRARGFWSIGYHYVIRLDGTIEPGRDVTLDGAHCMGWNQRSIGICYVGGLDKEGRPADTRTDAQRTALIRLVKSLQLAFPNVKQVIGHRDTSPDLNGDGIVTAEENADVDELSHKVRRRIIVGTVIFAIPCIVMTAGSIGSAQAGVQDGYGVTETTRELAAVLPDFKDYTVAVETSATEGDKEGLVEREVVAHVTTSEALGAHDRRVARKLIDLNVPELDRVEFDVE